MCSLKGGPRTSALPRRFPADPPVLQGNDSLCPLRIIIEHSRWNTPERFLRVTGCGVFLPRLGPAAGAPGPFCIQRERACSASTLPAPRPRDTMPSCAGLLVSPTRLAYIRPSRMEPCLPREKTRRAILNCQGSVVGGLCLDYWSVRLDAFKPSLAPATVFLPQAPEDQRWFWSITAVEHPPSVYNKGYSVTREQAMADFKARWLL
jgi:hypothetical protein